MKPSSRGAFSAYSTHRLVASFFGVALLGLGGGAIVASLGPSQTLSGPQKNLVALNNPKDQTALSLSATAAHPLRAFSDSAPTNALERVDDPALPPSITDPAAVERAAENAAKLTGVRKELLLGMMSVETVIGENMGRCTYGQVSDGAEAAHGRGALSTEAWATFQRQQGMIRTLAKELGYDAERLKVSCNPAASEYAGTGGAMGISQFMPATWYEYRDRLKKLSGKTHPDPWNVDDGVLAMALKLGDVPGVTNHDTEAEKRASKLYLSGSSSAQYEWYANNVQYWSENHNDILGDQYTLSLLMESLKQ